MRMLTERLQLDIGRVPTAVFHRQGMRQAVRSSFFMSVSKSAALAPPATATR